MKNKLRKPHKTVIVFINGKKRFIDKAIAPLIKTLNFLGMKTTSSCEGSCLGWHACPRRHRSFPGIWYINKKTRKRERMVHISTPAECRKRVVIWFDSIDAGQMFLNIILSSEIGRQNPRRFGGMTHNNRHIAKWLHLQDRNMQWDWSLTLNDGVWASQASVSFPKSDLPAVMDIIAKIRLNTSSAKK